MKTVLLLISLLCIGPLMAAKPVKLTVKWVFQNVNEGYDHDNKVRVYVDGVQLGESAVYKQSKNGVYELEISKGTHQIKVVNYALFEGKWEEHNRANNYSVDAFYEAELNCSSNITIDLAFDIATETANAAVSGGSYKMVDFDISWIYTNVEEGYDHQNRMEVYVDGKLVATSEVFVESKLGKMSLKVPSGSHDIWVENYAYYEGNWELHSIDNSYSLDAIYSANLKFSKKARKLKLTFDIKTLTTTPELK